MRTAGVAVIATAALAACSGINAQTASYATLAEARPAIERGWVPDGLPASAFELRAAYVPDGRERWGVINFRAEGAAELRALLLPEEHPLSGLDCGAPGRIEWWPVQLRGKLDAERIAATGAKAYRARSGNLLFIVNWNQGRAYYWASQ